MNEDRTIDLGEQGRPLMVFICDQVTVDADGNVLAVRPVPHFRYKLAVLKKDDKTLHVLESSGFDDKPWPYPDALRNYKP